MKVGDLVKYIWSEEFPHEAADVLGIIINIDEDGYYVVRFTDGSTMTDLVFNELEVVCK